jgi:hypothetical protein
MLVTCPECGAKISSDADPCPKCGCYDAGSRSEERQNEIREFQERERRTHEKWEKDKEQYIQLLNKKIQEKTNYSRWGTYENEPVWDWDWQCCKNHYYKIHEVKNWPGTDEIRIECRCAGITCGGHNGGKIHVHRIDSFLNQLTKEPPEIKRRKMVMLIMLVFVILLVVFLVVKWLF